MSCSWEPGRGGVGGGAAAQWGRCAHTRVEEPGVVYEPHVLQRRNGARGHHPLAARGRGRGAGLRAAYACCLVLAFVLVPERHVVHVAQHAARVVAQRCGPLVRRAELQLVAWARRGPITFKRPIQFMQVRTRTHIGVEQKSSPREHPPWDRPDSWQHQRWRSEHARARVCVCCVRACACARACVCCVCCV